MTFMVLVKAHARKAAPFLFVSGAQNKIALDADAYNMRRSTAFRNLYLGA